MNENTFWFSTWAVVGVTFSIMCLSIKSSNDSDNAVYKNAVDKGCSLKNYGGHVQIECPQGVK